MALLTATKTEQAIETEVNRLSSHDVVRRLVDLAGVVVTGTIGGVKTERAVRHWLSEDRSVPRDAELRFACRLALMIDASCGRGAVQGWFKGANSSLGDRAPALVLRDDFSEESQQRLLQAARRLMD